MALPLPTPLHGWRAFIGEVGIIVLGVLIALGAGQLVQEWQWRLQIELATQTFIDELGGASAAGYLRLAEQPCISAQRKMIGEKLRARGLTWEPLALKVSVAPTIEVPFTTEGWSNALASGTLNQLPYKQSLSLSKAYAAARAFSADERNERDLVARLEPLRAVSTLSPELRFSMLQTLSQLERTEENIVFDSVDLVSAAEASDLGLSSNSIRKDNAVLLKQARQLRGSCVKEPDISETAAG
jgi:hypothetical protein